MNLVQKKNYDDNYVRKDAEVKIIEQSFAQAEQLFNSTSTAHHNARVEFDRLVKDGDLIKGSEEYKTAKLPFDNAIKEVEAAKLSLDSARKELEPAKKSLLTLGRDYYDSKRAIEEKKTEDTKLQDELCEETKNQALKLARDAISSQKSIINKIYNDTYNVEYVYFTNMGIIPEEKSENVKFDENNANFIKNYLPLIKCCPDFGELLKKIVSSMHVIKIKARDLNTNIEFNSDHRIDSSNVDKLLLYINELPLLIEEFIKLIQEFNDILFRYKNAFVTLSFQIASTLFGYGVSILQIFMQNFPEQMNTFNEDDLYGLTQLNTLKAPFQPFVNAGDIANQEFEISDYAPVFTNVPGPTTFNLLLPIETLSSVPLFTKDTLQAASASGGGKKQRRLLPPRHKKRKTIKYKFNTTKKTNKPKKTKKTIKKGNKKRKTSIRKK